MQSSKGLCGVLLWERAGDRTETAYIWPHSYGRQRCAFLVLLMLNRMPRGPLCWVMAFFAASYQRLLWTPIQSGVPSPFGLVWLSLPHLVYNSVRSLTATLWLLSWLSYIIVQRTLSRLLDLWNHVLDRRQAEITVMQFRGPHFISQFLPTRFPLITAIRMCHFLPVHHLAMAFLAGSKVKIQHWFVVFFYDVSTFCGSFNAELNFKQFTLV